MIRKYRPRIRLLFSVGAFIFPVLWTAGCGDRTPPPPPAPKPENYARPAPTPDKREETPAVRFTDITRAAGIAFVHQNGYSGEKYLPETLGSGGGFFDYDNDGDLDLFLVNARYFDPAHNNSPPCYSALYENDGSGHFLEVTEKAGLRECLYGMGCAMADYDGDGDADLFLTAMLDGCRFYRNNGDGTFTDITQAAGLTSPCWEDTQGRRHPYWSTSAAFFDYDRDGWLDLLVCHYVKWSIENDIYTSRVGLGKSFTTPDLYEGLSPLLYRNQGDGTFRDVSRESGIWNPQAKALGAALADVDGNGYLDAAIANDSQPNFLYMNQGDGTFVEAGLSAGIAFDENGRARAGMGIDAAPVYQDRLTLAIGNFSHEPVSLYNLERPMFFVDAAGRARISRPTLLSLTFGLAFFDFDLDGFLDLALANGHIEPEIQKVEKEVAFAQPPQLFRQGEGHRFEEYTQEAGEDFSRPMVGRGLAYGDIDGDGDLDLLITACGEAPRLLRNTAAGARNHFIRFHLTGRPPNTGAIGARVALRSNGRTQSAWVRTGSSYLSQSELILTFGLGETPAIQSVEITWPDGTGQSLPDPPSLAVDTTHVVRQSSSP